MKELGLWWPRDVHIVKSILAKAGAGACPQEGDTQRIEWKHHTNTAVYDIESTFLEGKDEIHVLNREMKRIAVGISPFLQVVVGSGAMDGGEELYLIPEYQQVKPQVT